MAKITSDSVFATGPTGTSGLDSLTIADGSIWAEYGNKADSTGAGGASTIVRYSPTGAIEATLTIAGSVDGLKLNPVTGQIWALQNQDGNSTLSLIDPSTNTVSGPFTYAVTSGMSGYDDAAFVGGKVYLSYTNPNGAGDPVLKQLIGGDIPNNPLAVTTILADGATGYDIATGQADQPIPLSDPDSLKSLADGRLVQTSASDNTFAIISNPGQANQSVRFDTLTNLPTGSSLDDVIIPAAGSGTFYLSNAGTNQIDAFHATGLSGNDAYVSAGTELVQVNLATGKQMVLEAGLSGSHGLIFVADTPKPVVQNEKIFAVGSEVGGTQPDSITIGNGSTWVEYGNGADSTGKQANGGSSTIAQYDAIGRVLQTYTLPGSIDGLKIDPNTGTVWALHNQDANSQLYLIDPKTQAVSGPLSYGSGYVYGANSTHGFDDVAFAGNKVFLSETNPANVGDPVVQLLENGNNPTGTLTLTPILRFGDTGTNLTTGAINQALPVNDPDSLKTLADGSLILTSDHDRSLTFIHNPGKVSQTESFVTLPAGSSSLDDAIVPTTTSGAFVVSNSGADDVLKVAVTGLNLNDIYESVGSDNAIVQIDPKTGKVTTVVAGLSSPHGLAFIAAAPSLASLLGSAAASIGASYAAPVQPSAGASGLPTAPDLGGAVFSADPATPLVPALTGHHA